ncbi:hypothetical protein ATG98_0077 [Marinobacter sp. LV10R520-4]|nr:hypothetical protein ATG98_0077 [Marinobacter sp. LV10R520-4]
MGEQFLIKRNAGTDFKSVPKDELNAKAGTDCQSGDGFEIRPLAPSLAAVQHGIGDALLELLIAFGCRGYVCGQWVPGAEGDV